MKPAGSPAIEVPPTWKVAPLRSVASVAVSNVDKLTADGENPVRLCNYTDVYNNDLIHPGLELMSATATADEIARFRLLVGDVVITKDSESWDDIAVPALVAQTADDLVCGYHLAILRSAADSLAGAFLFRCLQARPVRIQLELSANGVTRFGLPKASIGSLEIPLPPRSEQDRIAEYLDRETARLDALVAAKERLLALLAEKRRSLVTRAVTRGLDPNVPMRDSGVPWLGEVPAHWRTMQLRRALQSMDYGISDSLEPTGKVAVLRMGDLQEGRIRFDKLGYVDSVPADLVLAPLDLVFNRTNSLDQVGKVGLFVGAPSNEPTSFASYLVRLRANQRALPKYLHLLLNSPPVLGWCRAEALPAIGQANLNPSRYGTLPVALPPLPEQAEIVSKLAGIEEKIDASRAATERSVSLLKERRAALISAAVTGRMVVPGGFGAGAAGVS